MLRGLEPSQLKWAAYVGKIDTMRDLLEKCRKLECRCTSSGIGECTGDCDICRMRKEIEEFQLTDT